MHAQDDTKATRSRGCPKAPPSFPLIPAELNVHPLLLAVLHAIVFLDGSTDEIVDPDAADEAMEYLVDLPAAPGGP